MNEVRESGVRAVVAPKASQTSSESASDQVNESGRRDDAKGVDTEVVKKDIAKSVGNSAEIAEQVKAAVAQMNEYVQSSQRDLHFSFDANSGETIVRVLDRETQEVVRQIPDEIFLKLAQKLKANEPIHLVSAQA